MIFIKRCLLPFCFIISLLPSCKQSPDVKNQEPIAQTNVDSLVKLGKSYMTAHLDSLLPVATQLAKVAQATGNKTALVYSEQFNANYYWFAADHKNSMALAVKCLADAEKWNIKESLPLTYLIIGNLHKENTNFKMAFEAQEKGYHWAKANQDTSAIITLLSLKAMFIHSYRKHQKTKDRDTSINIQLEALKAAESNIKYERQCIALYDNVSQYYLDNKDYNRAIYYGEKGAATALKYSQQRSLTYSYSWLGEAWFFKGNKQKGFEYLAKALQITKDLKEPYREMEVYQHYYDCYYSSGDYKTAIGLLTRVDKMRDSLQVVVNEKQIGELQIKYESAKKDNKIARMDRSAIAKNREIAFILTGSLLFVIFFIILVLQYRILHQNNQIIKKSHAQKELALENIAYIQAHELRKPVASILGLINVIKAAGHEVDNETITKLDEAAKELD
ncbi:MAG: hypothetical protein ACXVJE_19880, partial [Mucilaginibacter sp.]